MSTRRDFRAMTREAVSARPALPSFSAGSCSLSPPEGRLGVCAWALRGSTEATEPTSARTRKAGANEKDLKS